MWLSTSDVAVRIGCCSRTVSRAARRAGVGVYLKCGRLVAIAADDVPAIRSVVHAAAGNPNWISAPITPAGKKTCPMNGF